MANSKLLKLKKVIANLATNVLLSMRFCLNIKVVILFDGNNKDFVFSRLSNCIIPVIPHKTIAEERLIFSTANSTSLQEWLSSVNDLVDPPEPMPQEVVIKLHMTPPASGEEMQVCEMSPDSETSSRLPAGVEQIMQEAMEEKKNAYQPLFDVLSEVRSCQLQNILSSHLLVSLKMKQGA